jgi:hypothetical protein
MDALLFLVTEIKTPHGILYKIYYYGACDVRDRSLFMEGGGREKIRGAICINK